MTCKSILNLELEIEMNGFDRAEREFLEPPDVIRCSACHSRDAEYFDDKRDEHLCEECGDLRLDEEE